MSQSLFIIANHLNGVNKKRTKLNKIPKNQTLIEQKNNFRTKLTKLNENMDQMWNLTFV